MYSLPHTEQYVILKCATLFLKVIVHLGSSKHCIVVSGNDSSVVLVLKNPGQFGTAQAADRVSAAFVDIVPPRVKHAINTANTILFICFSFLHRGCLLYLKIKLSIIPHELNKKCATESPPHFNHIKYKLIIFAAFKIPVLLRNILDKFLFILSRYIWKNYIVLRIKKYS